MLKDELANVMESDKTAKITLQKDKKLAKGAVAWTSCKPFVENNLAVLIHRPRRVTVHKIGDRWPAHLAVGCWCGRTMTGTKKFTFLDAPPMNSVLCARCEDNAVANGIPSASQIVGHHVHTGGVVAVKRCCVGEVTC